MKFNTRILGNMMKDLPFPAFSTLFICKDTIFDVTKITIVLRATHNSKSPFFLLFSCTVL